MLQLVLSGPIAAAQDPAGSIDQLFPARPDGYLTDRAGVVGTGDRQAVEGMLRRIRDRTGAELAFVVLPTIGDRAAVDVAVAIGRRWGVGGSQSVGDPKRNAGLVLLLVPRDATAPGSGQVFLATGRGLEGIVTDAAAGRVRDAMLPAFRRGAYGEGLRTGAAALAVLLARGFDIPDSLLLAGEPPPRIASRSRGVPMEAAAILFVLVALIVAASAGRGGGFVGPSGRRRYGRRFARSSIWFGGGWGGGGGGFGGGGGGGGGFGGFGGGGGFSGGGAGGRF